MVERLGHRRVLHIALPILLSNATVPILGIVDTGVVGQMGQAAPIGAVGIGAIILSAIYWIFGFLRMGTAGLAAQAIGAKDGDEVAALLSRSLLIGVAAGVALIAAQVLLFHFAFAVSPASAEVEVLARQYLAIRIWSAPATLALYGVTGWLIAQERTRGVFVLQIFMNGLNILLDVLFVLVFAWGIAGVAWATFIAEWLALALGLWLCRDGFRGAAWRRVSVVFDAARLKTMGAVHSDILIRSALLQAIFVSFLFYGANFGDVTLAANQILLQFLYVTGNALDGFAFAAEALVGKAVGARDRHVLRRAVLLTTLWAAIFGFALTAIFFAFGPSIIDVMSTSMAVQAEARAYLPYMVAVPALALGAWMLDGIFIGATRTGEMRNMMAISAAIYFVAVGPLMHAFGNHGLWLGLLVSFLARGLTLLSRYPALERSSLKPI